MCFRAQSRTGFECLQTRAQPTPPSLIRFVASTTRPTTVVNAFPCSCVKAVLSMVRAAETLLLHGIHRPFRSWTFVPKNEILRSCGAQQESEACSSCAHFLAMHSFLTLPSYIFRADGDANLALTLRDLFMTTWVGEIILNLLIVASGIILFMTGVLFLA
jgi:hypothetical protein